MATRSAEAPAQDPARSSTGEQVLSAVDVRTGLDKAIHRGWLEIGRDVGRFAILAVSDAAASVAAALVVVSSARAGIAPIAVPPLELFLSLLIVQPFALGFAGAHGGAARVRRLEVRPLVLGLAAALALVLVLANVLQGPHVWQFLPAALLYAPIALTAIYFARRGCGAALNAAYRRGFGHRRVLLIGSAAQAARINTILAERDDPFFVVVGHMPVGRESEYSAEDMQPIEEMIRRTGANDVIVDSTVSFDTLENIVQRCFELGLGVMVVPQLLQALAARLEMRSTEAGAVLVLHPRGLRLPQLAVKRVLDVCLGIVLLVLSVPLWLLIAAAIRLETPGPITFRQRRVGVGARPFDILKFRTMYVDADARKHELVELNESGDVRIFKIRNDPRVTRVGRFLRRYSLDELPQLINIIRGEMSLVGPRPFFFEDLAGYEDHHMERYSVLPGLTGLWQVSGRSDIVDFEEVVRLDREYIRSWSLLADLRILLRTLPAVLRRSGAY